jgi:hypothetical protein
MGSSSKSLTSPCCARRTSARQWAAAAATAPAEAPQVELGGNAHSHQPRLLDEVHGHLADRAAGHHDLPRRACAPSQARPCDRLRQGAKRAVAARHQNSLLGQAHGRLASSAAVCAAGKKPCGVTYTNMSGRYCMVSDSLSLSLR